MATPLLPPVGQRVGLLLPATGEEVVSVVDGVEGGDVLVREPVRLDGAAADLQPDDQHVLLRWTSPGGRHVLTARATERATGRVPLWRLISSGTTSTTQLRRYARAADALPAEVVRDGAAWSAVISDLGEGGARCVVVQTQDVVVGDRLLLRVEVEDFPLELAAQVLDVASMSEGRSQLRLQFLDVGRAADVLRRRVLAQQRRARAVAP